MKILGYNTPLNQWMAGDYPFDRAKACGLCVSQHGRLHGCGNPQHDKLSEAAKKLIAPWVHLYPDTERRAQALQKIRVRFRKFFYLKPEEA
jgi:hypothetical protein